MASLQAIKKRIRSLESTQKMTAAMKQVAAAKFRRSQRSLIAARPYSDHIGAMLHRLAARVQGDEEHNHPLLQQREPKNVMLVLITSDRGMCGSFNTNLIRAAEQFLRKHKDTYNKIHLGTIGRKAYQHFTRSGYPLLNNFPDVFEDLTYKHASQIAEDMAQSFVEHELDAIFFLYHEFKSALSQTMVTDRLLPIEPQELPAGNESDYLYEPEKEEVLERLVPRYVATQVWRTLLESSASEHGARMTAMDNATKNAEEMQADLVLAYNKARQAAITVELMDIVGGAEAQTAKA